MTSYSDYLLRLFQKKYVAILTILVVTILSYANIFSNTFAWDDRDTILRWEETRTWKSVPAMIMGATPPGHPGNYRPIRNILYILAYKIWGTEPWGYHAQTIVLAAGISLLVFGITEKLYPEKFVPLVTALLFATHPIHVEALTWMTSMMDMFGMFFGFAAVNLFLLWRQKPSHFGYYLASWILAFLAIFSNEIALAIPLLIGLIMIIFPIPKQRVILSIFPYIGIILMNAWARTSLLHIGARFTYVGDSLYTTILVMLQAFLTYLRLLFIPTNLTINHDLGNGLSSWAIELLDQGSIGFKAVSSLAITTPTVLLSLMLILLLLVWALLFRKKYPIYAFGIFWFFIALGPVSNLIPTEAILTERYAFFASYGFTLIVAVLLTSFAKFVTLADRKSQITLTIILFLILTYMGITLQRNSEWANDYTLWTSATKRNPHAFIAHVSLGNYLFAHGDIEGALQAYLTAHEINPTPEDISMYIAAMYHSLGKNKESAVYLTRILRKNPWNIEAYFRLGNLYYKDLKNYELAEQTYLTALKLVPNHTQILNNLGVVYSIQGQRDKAMDAYSQALRYDPTYESARINLDTIVRNDADVSFQISDPMVEVQDPSRTPDQL